MKKILLTPLSVILLCAGVQSIAHAEVNYDAIVDLMVVYTPEARLRYQKSSMTKGDDAIKAKIVSTVGWMNRALEKSKTKTRVNLVWPHEVPYSGKNNYKAIWKSYDSGELKQVKTDRNFAGADLTVIIFDEKGQSGQASYGKKTAILRKPLTRLVSHEVGHLFGANHGYKSKSRPITNSRYDKGYQFVGSDGKTYVTLMAWSYASGESIPHYSNPDVNYAGVPSGVADSRDNARKIRSKRSSRSALKTLKPWRSHSKWQVINRFAAESLTTENGKPWNGTPLILGDAEGEQLAYQWNFTPISNRPSKYYIQPEQNDSKGIRFATGSKKLDMWSIGNSSTKRWNLIHQDNGFYRLNSDRGGLQHYMGAKTSGSNWLVTPQSSIPILKPERYRLEWELREVIAP